jgi:hypothetical protein
MPTDRENEILARIERELAADDPRLARLLSAPGRWYRLRRRRRKLLAFLVIVVLAALAAALALSL